MAGRVSILNCNLQRCRDGEKFPVDFRNVFAEPISFSTVHAIFVTITTVVPMALLSQVLIVDRAIDPKEASPLLSGSWRPWS
ncbi:hypothetical protein AOQ84DRAFT_35763 [Glonium stellatum]|uniref:Uncharacterized protein n=1 Tax=Glonium stellatum TaxID=574774 RepID=A0A8E2JT98_9PEZI|nr:hypothetical protein AOQ84DRAFT_35763 [Glonium stellatum]